MQGLQPHLLRMTGRTIPACAECKGDGNEMWNWHKGHIFPRIMECSERLILPPPDDLINVQKTTEGKRNAWMICAATKLVNDATLAHKAKFCDPGAYNKGKCMRIVLHSRPTPAQQLDNTTKRGWRLARIATEVEGCF